MKKDILWYNLTINVHKKRRKRIVARKDNNSHI